jgi:hypothetical protein
MARSRHHAERSFDHLHRMYTVDLVSRGMSGGEDTPLDLVAPKLANGDLKAPPALKLASNDKTSNSSSSPPSPPGLGFGGPPSGQGRGGEAAAGSGNQPVAQQALLDASTTEQPFDSPGSALPAASPFPGLLGSPSPPTQPGQPGQPGQPPDQPPVTPDPVVTPIEPPPIEVVVTSPQPPSPSPDTSASPGPSSFEPPPRSEPPAAAPVPEPSTWAIMMLGFGAVGAALRRRRGIGREAAV